MTEFKPGDVAVSVAHGYRGIFVDDCEKHPTERRQHWHNESGSWDDASDIRRPLVVIDPEDGREVMRLCDRLLANQVPGVAPFDALAEALREFAAPTPRVCDAILTLGNLRIECERDPGHITDHRNDSIGQGVRWGA